MGMDGVLRLYFGESNLPTPDYIKRAAVEAMENGYTFYTENAGLPSLRRADGTRRLSPHGGGERALHGARNAKGSAPSLAGSRPARRAGEP